MKKKIEIYVHILFWILFVAQNIIRSQLFIVAKPDAPFAGHFLYVNFLELFMGLIFFYTTFLCLPWASRNTKNTSILSLILLSLIVIFAMPAIKIGIIQTLDSIVPHLNLIFLAVVFYSFSQKQIHT